MAESKEQRVYGVLVVIRRNNFQDGSRFPVRDTECTIGRGANCNVVVHLASISLMHCLIKSSKNQKSVLKNKSSESTLSLNGKEMALNESLPLTHGDHIGLADRVMRWDYSKSSTFHPSNAMRSSQAETENKRIGDQLEERSRSSNRMVAVVPPLRHSDSKSSRSKSVGSVFTPGADFSRVTLRKGGARNMKRSSLDLALPSTSSGKADVKNSSQKTPASKSGSTKLGLAMKSATRITSARKTLSSPYLKSAMKLSSAGNRLSGIVARKPSPTKISFAAPEASDSNTTVSPTKVVSPRKSVRKETPAKGKLSAKKTPKTATKSPNKAVVVATVTPAKLVSPRRSVRKETPAKGKLSVTKTATKSPNKAVVVATVTPAKLVSPRRSVSKETPAKGKLSVTKTATKSPNKAVVVATVTPAKFVSPRRSVSKETPAKGKLSAKKTPKTATKSPNKAVVVTKVSPVKVLASSSKRVKKGRSRVQARTATEIGSGFNKAVESVRAQKRRRSSESGVKPDVPQAKIRKLESPKTLDKKKMAALYVLHHKIASASTPSVIVYDAMIPKSFDFNSKAKGSKIPLFTFGKQAKSPVAVKARSSTRSETPPAKSARKSVKLSSSLSAQKSPAKSPAIVRSSRKSTVVSILISTPGSASDPSTAGRPRKSSTPALSVEVKSAKTTPSTAGRPRKSSTPASSVEVKSAKTSPSTADRSRKSSTSASSVEVKSAKTSPSTAGRPRKSSTPASSVEVKSAKTSPSTAGRPRKSSTPASSVEVKSAKTSPSTAGRPRKSSTSASSVEVKSAKTTPSTAGRSRKSSTPASSVEVKSAKTSPSTAGRPRKSSTSASSVEVKSAKTSPSTADRSRKSSTPASSLEVKSAKTSPSTAGRPRKSSTPVVSSSRKSATPLAARKSASSPAQPTPKTTNRSFAKKAHKLNASSALKSAPLSTRKSVIKGSPDMFSSGDLPSTSFVKRSSKRGSVQVLASETPEFEKDAKKRLFSVLDLSPGGTPPTGSAKRNSAWQPSSAAKKTPASTSNSPSLQQLFQSPAVVDVRKQLSLSSSRTSIGSRTKRLTPQSQSPRSALSLEKRTPSRSRIADVSIVNSALVFKTPQSPRQPKRVPGRASEVRRSSANESPAASTSRASLPAVSPWLARGPGGGANSSAYDLIDLTAYDFDAVSTPNLRKEMLVSPGGIVQKSPKNSLSLVQGMKKLFQEKVLQKSPKNDLSDVFGVRRLMKTVPSPSFADVSTLGSLFDSPANLTLKRKVQFEHPDSPDVQWISPQKRSRRIEKSPNVSAASNAKGKTAPAPEESQPTKVRKGRGKAAKSPERSPQTSTSTKSPEKSPQLSSARKTKGKATEAPEESQPTKVAVRKGRGRPAKSQVQSPQASTSTKSPQLSSARKTKGKAAEAPEESPVTKVVVRRGRGKAVKSPERSPQASKSTKSPEKSPQLSSARSKKGKAAKVAQESQPTKVRKGRGKAAKSPERSPQASTSTKSPEKSPQLSSARSKRGKAATAPEESQLTKVAVRKGRGKAAKSPEISPQASTSRDDAEVVEISARSVVSRKGRAAKLAKVVEDMPASSPKPGSKRTASASDDSPVPPKIRRKGKAEPLSPVVETSKKGSGKTVEAKVISPRKTRGRGSKPAAPDKEAPAAMSPTPNKARKPAAKYSDAPSKVISPTKTVKAGSPQKSPAQVKPRRGRQKAVEDVGKAAVAKKAKPKTLSPKKGIRQSNRTK